MYIKNKEFHQNTAGVMRVNNYMSVSLFISNSKFKDKKKSLLDEKGTVYMSLSVEEPVRVIT